MPAETHQHSEAVDVRSIIELLGQLVDLDGAGPARTVTLGELDLADAISVNALWSAVTDEFGERTVGTMSEVIDEDDALADLTLDELARWFCRELTADHDLPPGDA